MADDKKISQLGVMTQAGSLDVLPIVNNSGTPVTEKITTTDLFANPQPIGSSNAEAGTFTTLDLTIPGATIDEFSTDVTLAGDSDTAVPTEKAVKAYVDANTGQVAPGTDEAVVRYDGTSEVQASGVFIDDLNNVTGVNNLDATTVTCADLSLALGSQVNEFSIDGTLAGDSDTAVPTEQAVKTYVDNAISNLNPNKIWQDDSYVEVVDDGTSAGYVKIVTDGVEVVNVSDEKQRFGKEGSSANITIHDGTAIVPVGMVEAMALDEDGLQLFNVGARVNEFSTDGTLTGNSDTALPTEKAVKEYVDSHVQGELNVQLISSDSTAVDNDAFLVDTTAIDVNVSLTPSANAKITIKKITYDSNTVIVTVPGGLIDGQPTKIVDSVYEAMTFICDGTNFYVI